MVQIGHFACHVRRGDMYKQCLKGLTLCQTVSNVKPAQVKHFEFTSKYPTVLEWCTVQLRMYRSHSHTSRTHKVDPVFKDCFLNVDLQHILVPHISHTPFSRLIFWPQKCDLYTKIYGNDTRDVHVHSTICVMPIMKMWNECGWYSQTGVGYFPR